MLGAYYDTNVNSTEYVFIETAVSLRSHAVCVREKKKKMANRKIAQWEFSALTTNWGTKYTT